MKPLSCSLYATLCGISKIRAYRPQLSIGSWLRWWAWLDKIDVVLSPINGIILTDGFGLAKLKPPQTSYFSMSSI